jgi:hypothetical protein
MYMAAAAIPRQECLTEAVVKSRMNFRWKKKKKKKKKRGYTVWSSGYATTTDAS